MEKAKRDSNGNRATNSVADLEPNIGDAPVAANATPTFDTQVRITFHHTRARLADIDGLSGKAAIDGLVEAGILSTDSPKQVTQVNHCQTKGKPEETRIVIEIEGSAGSSSAGIYSQLSSAANPGGRHVLEKAKQ